MARSPAVAAKNASEFFEFAEHAYPALHRHLARTLSADTLRRITSGSSTEWIPVELDAPYVGGVLQFLGPAETKKAYRRFMAEALIQSPTVRTMFDRASRLFEVSVGAFLRVVPFGMEMSYRDAFTLSVDRKGREAVVTWSDIAPAVLSIPTYPLIWEGILLGLYDLAHTAPQLVFELDPAARRADARLRW
jgi:hypothetical protein